MCKVLILLLAASAAFAADYLMLVGTYTAGQSSKGIYAYRFAPSSGKVTPLGLAVDAVNPSFLAIHPNKKFVYAVSEISRNASGERVGAVASYSLDRKSGKLTFLNAVSSKGAGPCHVMVDKTGKTVLVANYGGGSVAALPIQANGSLGEATSFVQHKGEVHLPKRQGGPRGHSANISKDNRFAVVADLGLDQLLVYRLDPGKGTLTPNNPPFAKVAPGSGPRHFMFHPSGKYGYVINEIASTVTAFSYGAARGAFTELQTITTIPKDFTEENNTAEVQVHSSGKFLYGSNRGHDSIAVFAIDGRKGTLTPVEIVKTQGETPRNFAIDPTGKYLFAENQKSNNIVVFRIDPSTGKLTPTGEKLEAGAPVCIKFVAAK
jgi:6-phosphogluconolactonase